MDPDYKTLLKHHEGVRNRVYKDSLGIATIACGFNLTRPDARQIITDVGADYDAVLSGQAVLTDDQVDTLLDQDIRACLDDLQTMFSNWDQLPDNAKLVLTDLRFNLGGHGLRGFPHTLAEFRAGNWKTAATMLGQSLWARQVGIRATEDIALLNSI